MEENKTVFMPTQKQIEYAQEISRFLEVPLPEEYTKEAYTDWIGAYAKEYRDMKKWCGK